MSLNQCSAKDAAVAALGLWEERLENCKVSDNVNVVSKRVLESTAVEGDSPVCVNTLSCMFSPE